MKRWVRANEIKSVGGDLRIHGGEFTERGSLGAGVQQITIKAPADVNVLIRKGVAYINTCTYTTQILIFIETRSIEMKPIYKLMKCYTHTPVPHIHNYTRPMSKNTVLCARLAPPCNLLAVGVTLPHFSVRILGKSN